MSRYRRRRYSTTRNNPKSYWNLTALFGSGVSEIRKAFLNLDPGPLDDLLRTYGSLHGASAEEYARKTFLKWKTGSVDLSGQTMHRLINLVPPYLTPDQRFNILQLVLDRHKRLGLRIRRTIKIDIGEPSLGLAALEAALSTPESEATLAHLPEQVMKAADWLYGDDITAARAMIAEADRRLDELIRSKAKREVELMINSITMGQIKSGNYSIDLPSGILDVVAFTPSALTNFVRNVKKWL